MGKREAFSRGRAISLANFERVVKDYPGSSYAQVSAIRIPQMRAKLTPLQAALKK